MGDLISRKALLEKLKRSRMCHAQTTREVNLLVRCENIVKEQPPVEPPKGEWIDVEEFYFDYKCSLCGGLSEFDTPFCQHCGAVMKEKV